MKNVSIKIVVATGIGAVLFLVISHVINISLFVPNTFIQVQYAVQALLSTVFGSIVGFIGQYRPWWSLMLASDVFGLLVKKIVKCL